MIEGQTLQNELETRVAEALDTRLGVNEGDETNAPTFSTPAEYLENTGKRFRMNNEEISLHGSSPEGRQAAFTARIEAGLL